MHFDPLILHWPGSELLLANKFYLLNTEEGSANSYSSLSFLLLPGVADDALVFCSFASWCCFTFVILGPVFPTPSRQRDLSPITCDNRQRFGLLFRSDLWQHGGFGCATSVHFFYPSHPKASDLMPLWTQPSSCWTCHKNDEQRLPLFKEDAGQLLHPQALVHWVRIQICVGEFLWLWLQWRQRNTWSFGKGTSLVSVTGKY